MRAHGAGTAGVKAKFSARQLSSLPGTIERMREWIMTPKLFSHAKPKVIECHCPLQILNSVGFSKLPEQCCQPRSLQSRITLPASPERICIETLFKLGPWVAMCDDGRDVETRLKHHGHLVPGVIHLATVDAANRQLAENDFVPNQSASLVEVVGSNPAVPTNHPNNSITYG